MSREQDPDADTAVAGTAGPNGGHAAEVIRLADMDPRHPGRIAAELRAHWDSLRDGKAIPARTEVQPQNIRRALDYAFILERTAPGAARFRLAGRHLIDLMGMEVRGMPICAFFNPAARGHVSDLLETVFAGPQILQLTLDAPGDYGRPPLTGHMLVLPLRSDLGDVTRALGCLIAEGETGRAPRRFDLDGYEVQPVIPGALTLGPTQAAAGFAEPPADWKARPRGDEGMAAKRDDGGQATPATAPPRVTSAEERRARFRVISTD